MTAVELTQLITAIAALIGACTGSAAVTIGWINSRKIRAVHDLTNSLAERAEAGARATGNLQGRVEQTAERKAEKDK